MEAARFDATAVRRAYAEGRLTRDDLARVARPGAAAPEALRKIAVAAPAGSTRSVTESLSAAELAQLARTLLSQAPVNAVTEAAVVRASQKSSLGFGVTEAASGNPSRAAQLAPAVAAVGRGDPNRFAAALATKDPVQLALVPLQAERQQLEVVARYGDGRAAATDRQAPLTVDEERLVAQLPEAWRAHARAAVQPTVENIAAAAREPRLSAAELAFSKLLRTPEGAAQVGEQFELTRREALSERLVTYAECRAEKGDALAPLNAAERQLVDSLPRGMQLEARARLRPTADNILALVRSPAAESVEVDVARRALIADLIDQHSRLRPGGPTPAPLNRSEHALVEALRPEERASALASLRPTPENIAAAGATPAFSPGQMALTASIEDPAERRSKMIELFAVRHARLGRQLDAYAGYRRLSGREQEPLDDAEKKMVARLQGRGTQVRAIARLRPTAANLRQAVAAKELDPLEQAFLDGIKDPAVHKLMALELEQLGLSSIGKLVTRYSETRDPAQPLTAEETRLMAELPPALRGSALAQLVPSNESYDKAIAATDTMSPLDLEQLAQLSSPGERLALETEIRNRLASSRAQLEQGREQLVARRTQPEVGPSVSLNMLGTGKPIIERRRFSGPVIENGIEPGDAVQGALGDCYFVSAMSSIAKVNPKAIEDMIVDHGDGTYTVTFKERDPETGKFRDVKIGVDASLFVRKNGGVLFGRSDGDQHPERMELWFPLIEKAFAKWKGSYNGADQGGRSHEVFEAVLGRPASLQRIDAMDEEALFARIKQTLDAHEPVCAGTRPDVNQKESGIVPRHAYSVLGYEEKNGERFVTLRNPWGRGQPDGNGVDDGVFTLSISELQRYFGALFT